MRRARHLVLQVVPGHVVPRQFLKGVERHHIVNVQRHAPSLQSRDNTLQLVLVLRLDLGPKHLARRLAEELPIALGGMRVLQLDRFKSVSNFRRQQVTVLEADAFG